MVNAPANLTAATLFLSRTTAPKLKIVATVGTLVVHIADTAVRAFDFSRKAGGVQALIRQCTQFFSPCNLILHILECFHIDDWLVGILHEILRQFATVLFAMLCDRVLDELLLQEKIPCVGDIGKHHLNVRIHPSTSV